MSTISYQWWQEHCQDFFLTCFRRISQLIHKTNRHFHIFWSLKFTSDTLFLIFTHRSMRECNQNIKQRVDEINWRSSINLFQIAEMFVCLRTDLSRRISSVSKMFHKKMQNDKGAIVQKWNANVFRIRLVDPFCKIDGCSLS